MTLLGTFIDKATLVTLNSGSFPVLQTIQHSLGTTPDEVRFALRSVPSATTVSIAMGIAGNASLSTIYAPSVYGAANVAGDVYSIYYMSLVR